ncbi:MAG TPA: type II toxin-antitoxin system RelE/ParE family toxin [Firmicutes bacterium]|nr:type II toxin-antitoxin system RelE/ParE family toxin [Bacillota bacterium]
MSYHVQLTDTAKKQLKKMDRQTASMLLGWMRRNLEGCENPRQHGKGLSANRSGQWRYRVGNYRLIAEIEDDQIVILILSIGHRSDVYKSKQ